MTMKTRCTYLRFFGKRIKLPNFIKPFSYKHNYVASWEEGKPKKSYTVHAPREYGFYYFNEDDANHFVIKYGIQEPLGASLSDDGYKEKYWSCFLPWREYNTASVKTVSYSDGYIIDKFDGERIEAEFKIVKYEQTRGTALFNFLKYLYRSKIFYSLHMDYESEVGSNKGAGWKGGTLSISVPIGSELTDEAVQNGMNQASVYAFTYK